MLCGVQFFVILLMSTKCLCQMHQNNVTAFLLKYEGYMKASQDLDKSDKALLKSWAAVAQVDRINVTSHYRLEMVHHKEHSFSRNNIGQRWLECLSLHQLEIKRPERNYYRCEADCLQVASVADHQEKKAVHQVAKEIKQWRKSFRYLANQCHLDNPRNEDAAGACLVEYIQRDNYDLSLQRLMNLKQKCIADVYLKMAFSSNDLNECLKTCLSQFLYEIRNVMDTLHLCYEMKSKYKE
ncbi:uncharacterized protein LOC123708522 [Pieris brassicae]|uniref:uncharacterized protein LOC123708522 n=1 Tax=Pieris brassicae TaxID=7116 RepID=UPI001E65FA0A|nr:uncharacterized protein LOC123708522 [Pieris brassicae]